MFNVSPVVLWLVIANVATHVILSVLPDAMNLRIDYALGLVSIRFTNTAAMRLFEPLTLLSYQFLHGSIEHLGVNMLALLAFGVGLERWIGSWKFLGFYLLCGIGGGLAQIVAFPDSPVPLIGASGAISGCFAAIIRLMAGVAQARGGPSGLRQVAIIAVVWLVSQVAFGVIGPETSLGVVAWWAHIGGFLVGLVLIGFLTPRQRA